MLPIFRFRQSAERLVTTFRWLEPKPLPESTAEHYSAGYERGAYALTLRRESMFAWETLDQDRQIGDFVLEADIELDPANGHSAAGVIFRHVNDENFYSLLLSSRGNFRVDLLFNTHPMHLVEWTPLPVADGEAANGVSLSRSVRVVGHGSRFSFQVDDEWVAEVEDEVLPSGGIGFAAQNFVGTGTGVFRLRRLALEARPMAVEREHLRWSYYLPVSPVARLRLAETLFNGGAYQAAAVQLRKGLKDREGSAREHYLLSQCYARLSMNDDALASIERVLALEPSHAEARREKANLLYLANRLLEARDVLRAGLADGGIGSTSGIWNLLGNAEYGLGNMEQALEAYRRAIDLQPDLPLFLRNAAHALERLQRREEAADLYLRAARMLFSEEAFDELSLVVPRARALAPDNPEIRGMEAKMLYREGKTDEAFALLRGLEESGTDDSAVHYLLGIILAAKGMREESLPRLERAAILAPDFPLYQFRLAETLHLLGRDPSEPLAKALSLAPEDPWSNNLAGQLRLEASDPNGALEFLNKAQEAAPEEEDIALNLSEALSLVGRHEEALEVIEASDGAPETSARAANQQGNVLTRMGEYAEAVRAYETAIRLAPENATYKENCASACIEVDMVHRAEELLAQIEPEHPTASVYNLLGNVAALKGERARAEEAYLAGLARDPGNPDLAVNLAMLHRERGNFDKARELLLAVLSSTPAHARARTLLERIRDEREQRLTCSICGREWWAPKSLPPQPAIRIRGEPPAEAPAGRCPKCGKLYCISCASAHVREMRFYCPDDDQYLKLSEDPLKWLLARYVERSSTSSPE
jgi:tetratricopeptide (TPR) repeat protein